MIIRRWQPGNGVTNFGDQLVEWLAPKLFTAKLAEAPGTLYFIGTLLGEGMATADRPRVVFGAGAGYSTPPRLTADDRVYFVRGPQTAARLGGVPFITDPGLFIHHFAQPRAAAPYRVPCAFMPRWDSMSPELADGCRKAGIEIVDPRLPVEVVVDAIRHTNLLLTEALHGAVVADALRVPWISIYAQRGHEFKWYDWCGSLGMIWNPIDAQSHTLSWARDYAVPQLSAQSVLDARKRVLDTALADLNRNIAEGRL